jgi:hypothetical protein
VLCIFAGLSYRLSFIMNKHRLWLNTRAIHVCRSDMQRILHILTATSTKDSSHADSRVHTFDKYKLPSLPSTGLLHPLSCRIFTFIWQNLHSRIRFSFPSSDIGDLINYHTCNVCTHRQRNNKRIYQKSLVYKYNLLYVYMHSSFSASVLVFNS